MGAVPGYRRPPRLWCPIRFCSCVMSVVWCCAQIGCDTGDGGAEGEKRPEPIVQEHESEEYRLTLTCDRDAARVADPVRLELTVEYPATARVLWPALEGDWGGFAVASEPSEIEHDEQSAKSRASKRYVLRALQSGSRALPELTVRFRGVGDHDEETDDLAEIRTDRIDFEIASVLSGSEEPQTVLQADGNPVELRDERRFRWEWLIAGIAGLVVLALGCYRLLRWLRDHEPPEVIIPAHRWALDRLDRLAEAGLIERGETHEYYFRLSDIVRGYVERRFEILAPEMTTDEFTAVLRNDRVLDEPHRRLLGPFLTACDLVKFARHVPGREEADGAFESARSFVVDSADYGKPSTRPAGTTEKAA